MFKELSEMSLKELWELFPIILKKHNKEYKNWYFDESNRLINCIGSENIFRINHIGSSSVKGIISKPTVDILLEIEEKFNLSRLVEILKKEGWTLMFEQKEPYLNYVFNKGYTKYGYAEKVYHLHVRNKASWDELYFRDYLIENKDISKKYEKLKLSLVEKFRYNRDGYTDAKTNFIKYYTKKAREKYKDRY